jgi:predicted Zn-ribbon and HTH transcriptional regulator
MTRCDNCGYEWDYTGRLQKATCPSCQSKTDVGDG